MAKQFIIKSKSGEEIFGSSDLSTVVLAAADVFERPQRRGEETRALVLASALNSAHDAGVQSDALETAQKLGEMIGLRLRGRNQLKLRERPEFVVRDSSD